MDASSDEMSLDELLELFQKELEEEQNEKAEQPQKKKFKTGRPAVHDQFPEIIPVITSLLHSNGSAAQNRRRTQTISFFGVCNEMAKNSSDYFRPHFT